MAFLRDLESLSNQLQTLGRKTTGILHAIGQQATMVNETWRELGELARIMCQLEKAHGALEKKVNKWKINILEKVGALKRQSAFTLRIECALEKEGDRARQENATNPQAYPYELWRGVVAMSGSAGVCWWVCILLSGGRMEEQGWSWGAETSCESTG